MLFHYCEANLCCRRGLRLGRVYLYRPSLLSCVSEDCGTPLKTVLAHLQAGHCLPPVPVKGLLVVTSLPHFPLTGPEPVRAPTFDEHLTNMLKKKIPKTNKQTKKNPNIQTFVVGAECGQERTPRCKVRKVFIYFEDTVELV